jgi:hypothetical protein
MKGTRVTPFYDRDAESADIEAAVRSPRAELRIVYGRRGAGKSTLFEHALEGRAHFSYTCTQRVLSLQLADMQRALTDFTPHELPFVGTLTTFDDFLNALATLAKKRTARNPLIVVIDELPYLAHAERGVLTDLQRWFNTQKRAGVRNLKLFLLGSMVSWMHEQALSDTAALKSVRTGQMAVHPLGYRHAASFYSKWPAAEKVRAFGVWGGLPSVLAEIDAKRSLWKNIEATTLTRGAKLYDEPGWLQYTDLRDKQLYSSMIRAVASGARRPSEIAKAVRATDASQASQIQPYLERLRDAQILERRTPLLASGERPKSSLYYVSDQFLAYWYRFVDPEQSALDHGQRALPLRRIKDGLDKYVSEDAFECVSRAYLWDALAAGRLPKGLGFDRVGSWWSGRGEPQDEADVVAYAGRRLVLVGECKWTNSAAGEDDLAGVDKILRDFARELAPSPTVWRALFARNGFGPALKTLAKDPAQRILLLEPAELYW